jgi:hypothetical protein
MRGEFIGVWSETSREIWQPLITHSVGDNDEGVPDDIFCELYRELSRSLRQPTDEAALGVLPRDGIALREAFEGAAQRGKPDLIYDVVKEAFARSGVEKVEAPADRRFLVVAALSELLGQPAGALLEALLQEQVRDTATVVAAWQRTVERTINDPQASREAFNRTTASEIAGERALVGFLESVHSVLEEFENSGDDSLSNRYFNLLSAFIEKFSLRYDLRRPCTLCPTLTGVFASLIGDLRALTSQDLHLDGLMKDFEESIRDLRIDCSDRRIKTSIQKQVNLLEALGRAYPGVRRKTLTAISKQLRSWPHEELRVALQSTYTFTCDYPGIRHGGTPANALRAVDMRDMVAVSILLAGFAPYLAHGIDADVVYRRA